MSAATVVNSIINMTLLSRRLKSSFCPGPYDHGSCSSWGQAHFPHVTLAFCQLCICSEVTETMSNDKRNGHCGTSQSQLRWGETVQVHCGSSNSKKQNKTENHLIAATKMPKDFSHLPVGNSPPQQGRSRLTLFKENENLKGLRTEFSCKGKIYS